MTTFLWYTLAFGAGYVIALLVERRAHRRTLQVAIDGIKKISRIMRETKRQVDERKPNDPT